MEEKSPQLDTNHPGGTGRAPGGSAELWALALPVIVATLSQTLMGLVDTFFMGRIGTAEQGAVGIAAVIFITISSLFIGTVHGVATFVAQHHGAEKYARCGRDGWMGLYFCIPAALVLGSISFLSQPIFTVIGLDHSTLPHATDYLFIRLAGVIFPMINFALVNFLRGIGDTRTPMWFTLGANVLNAFLNYALVLGNWGAPRLGATGAALATVIATAVFSLVYIGFFLSGERHRKYGTRSMSLPSKKDVVAFLKIGGPIGGIWTLEMASWSVFMAFVSHLGNAELAATNITFQVLHFSFMGAVSLATAATTLVGQYLGAEDPETAKKTARTTIRWGITYCVTVGSVFLLARHQIVAFFNADRAVVEIGGRLFVYAAVFQFFDGLGISSNGVIRGAGDTRWPMVLMVILAWGVFVPLTYTLTFALDWGIDGAWIAVVVFIAALGIGLYFRQRSGKWLGMRV